MMGTKQPNKWLGWKPPVFIASASLVAGLIFFSADIPHELIVVLLVVALVSTGQLLRKR
jgi:hypothetical protein